uniref:Uncharacterized protein n=1 Tax=Arundo donax TaxID=35708 RepID=A0A0A9EAU7_ARUDO
MNICADRSHDVPHLGPCHRIFISRGTCRAWDIRDFPRQNHAILPLVLVGFPDLRAPDPRRPRS